MFIPVLFLLPTVTLPQIIKPNVVVNWTALETPLKQISRLYFNSGITLVIYNKNGVTDHPNSVLKIMSEEHPTQVSNTLYEKPEWYYLMFLMDSGRADNIIVILEGMDVEKALMEHREQALWNSQARILIIIDCDDCETAAAVGLKTVWATTKSLNVVFMTIGTSSRFFTCPMYTECHSTYRELTIEENFFPLKIPKTFSESVFTVATTVKEPYVLEPEEPLQYTDGVEIKIMSVIAKNLDFDLQFTEAPPGESPYLTYNEKGDRVGLLAVLYRQQADLACFGTGLGNDRYYAADALMSHTQDALVWMAPAPGLRSNWDSVYIAFSWDIWMLVLLFLITIAVTFRWLSTQTEDGVLFPTLSKCVLDSWAATLNLGITSRPKSHKMKCFLTVVLLYAVIISSAYQSFLITLLTSQRRAKGFNTIEEAVDAGIVAYIFPSGMYMYNQSNHETWNKILSPRGHVKDTSYNYTQTLIIVEKPPYAVSLMIQYSADFIVRKYFLRHSGALVRPLAPYFTTYPITFYMSPGHPLRWIVNEKVSRLIEAGLPEKWLKDVLRDAEDWNHDQDAESDSKRKPLSLAHLEVTFLILGFGLIVSLVGFIFEMMIGWKMGMALDSLSFSTTFAGRGSLPRSMSRGSE